MAETTARNSTANKSRTARGGSARAHFSKALEEAKAGAQALGKEAQAKAGEYRGKATERGSEWIDEARTRGSQARDRAMQLAAEGKGRASSAIASLGKAVAESAETIDEKLGARYGDYARTAAQTMQEAAARIEAKDLGELGEDIKEFVRKSPGLAIGLAAVAGFMVASVFRGSRD